MKSPMPAFQHWRLSARRKLIIQCLWQLCYQLVSREANNLVQQRDEEEEYREERQEEDAWTLYKHHCHMILCSELLYLTFYNCLVSLSVRLLLEHVLVAFFVLKLSKHWQITCIINQQAVQYTLPLWTSETTPLEVTSGWTFNKPMKFTLGKLASGLVPDY